MSNFGIEGSSRLPTGEAASPRIQGKTNVPVIITDGSDFGPFESIRPGMSYPGFEQIVAGENMVLSRARIAVDRVLRENPSLKLSEIQLVATVVTAENSSSLIRTTDSREVSIAAVRGAIGKLTKERTAATSLTNTPNETASITSNSVLFKNPISRGIDSIREARRRLRLRNVARKGPGSKTGKPNPKQYSQRFISS